MKITMKFQDTDTREELNSEYLTIPPHLCINSTITHYNGNEFKVVDMVLSTVTNHGTVYFAIKKIN